MNWMKGESDEEGGVMRSELKGKSQGQQFIISPVTEMVKAEGIQIYREKIHFGHVQLEMPRKHTRGCQADV